MLKKKDGLKIAIRIVLLIDVVLLVVLMTLGIKWFLNYLEIKEISKIWPEGEFVILQCGVLVFAVAAIIFCVRMIYLDFLRYTYKAKVEEYEAKGHKPVSDDGAPAKKEKKPARKPAPTPAESGELARLRRELAAAQQWRRNAGALYPDIERRVAESIENSPM